MEAANEAMRRAVKDRLDNTDPNDEKLIGYKPESCCDGRPFRGDSLLAGDVHPTSQRFFDLCDLRKEIHR